MGKVKNKAKKKRMSDRVVKPDSQKKKVLNPFEIHVNRQKYSILGRKTKNDKGLPGIARAKAITKRKKTLLQEFRIKDKSNRFLDRRIGEKNSAMTAEDRIMARFTVERMKMHNKKSIFNLADDEILTHHGQTLNEIEKFDDPRSDDEEEEETGKLDSTFVEDAHFGGGMLKRSSSEGHTSRKDLIDQLIAESKIRKAEKQRAREQTIELTEKLDTEWKDLLPVVSASKTSLNNVVDNDDKPDSYDTVMRQLKFEARGKPLDRLKSEDELAREEKERLEKLERERLQRMRGLKEDLVPERKHRSADDLDDGFEVESEEEVMMSYNADGELEMNTNHELEQDEKQDHEQDEERERNSSHSSEESEQFDDNDEEDEDNIDDLSDLKNVYHSDDENTENKGMVAENVNLETMQSTDRNYCEDRTENKIKIDLLARKEMMERARSELPYTFKVPDTYEELQAVLCVQSPHHQAVILERMMKCNHPSLGEGMKDRLTNLFGFLLQHLQDTAVSTENEEGCNCFAVLDSILPHLYDLSQITPQNTGHCVADILKEKQQDFRAHCNSFPGLDTLVFLKLISHLFPTSDFRHPVVTPAFVFICQMLHQCRVKTTQDIATGLFLVTLILEYTVLSKRFSPAVVNFLCGVLDMGVSKTCAKLVSVVYPVHIAGKARNLLVLSEPSTVSNNETQLMNLDDLQETLPEDDSFKLRALHTAVKLLLEFCCHLENMSASYHIFKPVLTTLKQLEVVKYPSFLQEDIKSVISKVEKMEQQKLQFLVMEKKKPKALRLYEPRVEEVFDGRKRRPMGRERQEHEKLLHKYKREMKGAIREIRRDKSFLAKLKLKQTLQK
ncbi:nucleolar protein 14 homolog [Zootermopsis nevadensis]|uniref:nucleolar protein 14 homolog n=1 Tax=Zootermopsis nevadensis TaxID=136037 RepID=UPI000B8E368E|nr:nucleolar protein 14 homolog [Zootermopsis nevadensis]